MDSPLVCGIDEAGRGALAGPVVAAAVILPLGFPVDILADSKKLSPKKRMYAREVICEGACWGIGVVDHLVIDKVNILQASLLAMKRAYMEMEKKFNGYCLKEFGGTLNPVVQVVVDGTFVPEIDAFAIAQPKADSTIAEVMAASILAKTFRDGIMDDYARLYPEYRYQQHKGYPTRAHKELCHKLGASPIQRLTFKF